MRFNKFWQIATLLLGTQSLAHAALQLELTQGMSGALPIAVVSFAGDPNAQGSSNNISSVVQTDLQNSGRFKLLPSSQLLQTSSDLAQVDYNAWKQTGINDLVVGNVKSLGGGNYQVSFSLLDVYKGAANASSGTLINQIYKIRAQDFRSVAHQISDLIYQQLTGYKGIFSTKIAYVLVENSASQNPKYFLEVADADGFNPRPILVSDQPIMSPTWSPDGKRLAYASFENQHESIYISNISTGQRQLISSAPGINGAPAFSPDGTKLALVLSTTGVAKIYVMDLATRQSTQITDGLAIDTEPSWAPDGKSLIFTSNRGGGPEIYRYYFDGGKVQRVTFDGPYNATASFTPNSNQIILLHQEGNAYNIAVQDLASGDLSMLTRAGDDSSPSIAPNGQMILYASGDNTGELAMVSLDGSIKLRIPAPEGNVREAVWSPFLS